MGVFFLPNRGGNTAVLWIKTIKDYCFFDEKAVILHPNLKQLFVGKFIENNNYTFHYITKN